MQSIRYSKNYLNEKICAKYRKEELYRYFTRGGVVSLVIEGEHKRIEKIVEDYGIKVDYYYPTYVVWEEKFLKRWNNSTYWDANGIVIAPDYLNEGTDYKLGELYKGVIIHYLTTTNTNVDTLVLYFAEMERYENILKNVHKYPLIFNRR